jgi:hypothetical protein
MYGTKWNWTGGDEEDNMDGLGCHKAVLYRYMTILAIKYLLLLLLSLLLLLFLSSPLLFLPVIDTTRAGAGAETEGTEGETEMEGMVE